MDNFSDDYDHPDNDIYDTHRRKELLAWHKIRTTTGIRILFQRLVLHACFWGGLILMLAGGGTTSAILFSTGLIGFLILDISNHYGGVINQRILDLTPIKRRREVYLSNRKLYEELIRKIDKAKKEKFDENSIDDDVA